MPWGIEGGLDLDRPDAITAEEYEHYARTRCSHLGYPDGMPIWPIFRDYRPDLLKSHMQNLMGGPGGWHAEYGDIYLMLDFHLYIIRSYVLGVYYELVGFQNMGWTRAEVLDTFAVVNLHAASMGLNEHMTPETLDILRNWKDPDVPPRHFPQGWVNDPELLRSGIDHSEPGMTDGEVKLLEDWYLRVAGEIPRWLPHLAEYNRPWLKTWRMRWENALKVQPSQMLPIYLLHYDMLRGYDDGVRENLLLAKGLGVSKDIALASIHFGGKTYGGTAPISLVDRAAGDVLRDW